MNLLESVVYGLIAGLTEILPVSSQAHRILMLNLYGESTEPALLRLLIHLGILAGLYYGCQNHITRITRAMRLAKIPKRRRKRPLDTRSLIDLSILRTMVIPIILGFLFYNSLSGLSAKLVYVSACLFLNGLILHLPQYLPGANKDSQTFTRAESWLMGLGGAASMLPGVSCIGAVSSIGTVCGVDRSYALDLAMLIDIPVTIGLVIFDLIALFTQGVSGLSFPTVLAYIVSAAAAFGGIYLGMRLLRALVKNQSTDIFSYYSLGAALFAFILFLNI